MYPTSSGKLTYFKTLFSYCKFLPKPLGGKTTYTVHTTRYSRLFSEEDLKVCISYIDLMCNSNCQMLDMHSIILNVWLQILVS